MSQIKPETPPPTIYCDAKQLAVDYQTAKMEVCALFVSQYYHCSLYSLYSLTKLFKKVD